MKKREKRRNNAIEEGILRRIGIMRLNELKQGKIDLFKCMANVVHYDHQQGKQNHASLADASEAQGNGLLQLPTGHSDSSNDEP